MMYMSESKSMFKRLLPKVKVHARVAPKQKVFPAIHYCLTT